MYGLYRNRYLVILNEPRRIAEELDIDAILNLAGNMVLAEAWGVYRVFCDILGMSALFRRQNSNFDRYFSDDIAKYFASDFVCAALEKIWAPRSSVTDSDIAEAKVLLASHHRSVPFPDPANNLIFILIGLRNSNKIGRDHFFSTLASIHFRLNISPAEVIRMHELFISAGTNLLGRDAVKLAISNLEVLLEELGKSALRPAHFTVGNSGPFKLRSVSPNRADEFSLILQERI